MEGPGLTEIHINQSQRNLAAISELQPDLARQIQSVAIPAGARMVPGRDGSDTFLIDGEGRSSWLGRSSMTEISAPILVRDIDTGGQSVILHSIATALEPILAARQLPGHSAVFVFERDLACLRMALHLRDLSSQISERRIVLLHGANASEALVAFFGQYPGFEFPQHFLPLRHLDGNQDQARAHFEAGARQVTTMQWQLAGQISGELQQRGNFEISHQPRVTIVSRDARPEVLVLAGQLVLAARGLGWHASACVPDRPDRCHTVARLAAIRDHEPDMLILLNGMLGPLANLISPRQPLCHWLVTADGAAIAQRDGLSPRGTVFCVDEGLAGQMRAAGMPAERVRLLEIGIQPPEMESVNERFNAAGKVAVIADCESLDASAIGISLASQVKLWEQLIELAGPAADRWTDSGAASLLDHAERKTHTSIKESSVRQAMIDRIRHRLMPGMVVRATVRRLIRNEVPVVVYGCGWEGDATVAPLVRNPPESAEQRWQVFRSAAVTVFPWFDRGVPLRLMECLASGGCPVVRAAEFRVGSAYPGLAPVLKAESRETVRSVAATVQSLLNSPKQRAEVSSTLRQEVLNRHTLACRLETMRTMLQTA
jgi:hypothetical protein